MMNIIKDGMIKTRKEHKCHGCLEVIPKGTVIYSQTNVYDGKIYTLYMCSHCNDYCKLKNCKECYELEDAFAGFIKECMRQN